MTCHSVHSAVKFLQQIATPEELDLLSILLADRKIAMAFREGDSVTLSRVFAVSCLSYEDVLRNKGVQFKNGPGTFNIVVNRKTVLTTPDDILGTVGCSVVARCVQRDGSNLQSSFLAGGRYRAGIDEMAGAVDRLGVKLTSEHLPNIMPQSTKACAAVSRALERLPPEYVPDADLARWASFLSATATMYTTARSLPQDVIVRDPRPVGKVFTVGQYLKSSTEDKADPKISLLPKSGDCFTDIEKQMIEMLELEGFDFVTVEGVDYYMRAHKSAYEYIGSHYIDPPSLPDFDAVEVVVEQPERHAAADPEVSRGLSPVSTEGEAEMLLKQYFRADHNKIPQVIQDMSQLGGLSAGAKELWASLSKACRNRMMKPVRERKPFRDHVSAVAEAIGEECNEALAELVACRIIVGKSAYLLDPARMLVERK